MNNNKIYQFLESIDNANSVRVIESILKNVQDNENIEQYNTEELEEFVLSLKPNNPKAVITACYVLNLYDKWLKTNNLIDNDNFHNAIQSIDRSALWKKSKPNVPPKFISPKEFKDTLHNIGMYEEFNSLYYQTLLQCVYEGVYADDMSVIKNLRAADIKDETTILLRRDDGTAYEFEVSPELTQNLKELGKINIWQRRNRNGICQIPIIGNDIDSCFKLEKRNANKDDSYKYSYYARLRKVSKDYLERNVLPFSLFVSGIMHRIENELLKNNISLEEAFSENNRNRLVGSIIAAELERCHYDIEVWNFREIVKGHIDTFSTSFQGK